MKKMFIFLLTLFSITLYSKENSWEAIGKGLNCQPSRFNSFFKFKEDIDRLSSDSNTKFVVVGGTEKFGYYALGSDMLATVVWAETQEKCEFGVHAVKARMAIAVALTEFNQAVKNNEQNEEYKGLNTAEKIFKKGVEKYHELYENNMTIENLKKELKTYAPDYYKVVMKHSGKKSKK